VNRVVSATRMELLRLRQRLFLARRGHHLLKGKQDELLRRFLLLLEEYLKGRRDLNGVMERLARKTGEVRSEVSLERVRVAAWPPPPEALVTSRPARILNLQVAAFDLHPPTAGISYGPEVLPAAYDELVSLWRRSLPLLVEIAEREKALRDLAAEIERTRRRVNALEFNLIPGLEEGIRTIRFKLAEGELGSLTRLMRVKDIVRRR
jgi:V/A-type H+-transporting ATPase subunit D